MPYKRLVVLANSYKKEPGRCIAGREIGVRDVMGGWLRPVSRESEGELLPHHIATTDHLPIHPFDIVEVPVLSRSGDKIHPEDWHIDPSVQWRREGTFIAKRLAALEEKPSGLWLDPSTPQDRATANFLLQQSRHQSLHLISPTDFHIQLTHEFNKFKRRNQQKKRVCFTYNDKRYSLSLTDPVFIEKHPMQFPEPGKPALIVRPKMASRILLCVSLTPLFNGHHYKVVASILELP